MKLINQSMGVYEWKLTGPEFIHNFIKFNNTFKGKNKIKPYKKIDYETWCKFNKHDNGVEARIKYNINLRTIYIYAGSRWCHDVKNYGTEVGVFIPYSFFQNDGSFGNFLYRELIDKEVKDMSNTINNCTTATSYASQLAADKAINTSIDYKTNDGTCLSDLSVGTGTYSDYYTTTTADKASNAGIYTYNNATSVWDTLGTKADIEEVAYRIDEHEKKYHNKNNKENEKMKFANFDFGPCTGDNIRMSMYGLAVKNASGTWVSYDANSSSIMDVDIFNFDGAKFLYKMPVAIKDIKRGDVIIHARKPMFVTAINSMTVTAVDPVDGELKDVVLTKSPFGFNFATKVVNFIDGITSTAATEANPFGNMWMFMLMSDSGKMDDILPLMLMSQNGGNMNPMMMYALMGDNKNVKDILPFLLMGNGWTNFSDTSVQN